LRRITLFKGEI